MTDLDLYLKLTSLPENLKKEVSDFMEFLLSKKEKQNFPKKQKKDRQAGLAKGLIRMKDDFDEPLDDFKDYMD